ncbi:hypothetical protein DM860_006328 [Cuscuta australis]|uniref:ABC transporter domain-containing protein n=1 Tax=Cuscuta australis TaxID=267555 RepID=A0A328D712_9ASTE|nr:hypothetical protein DM860_006328 [Cuscuta australis]
MKGLWRWKTPRPPSASAFLAIFVSAFLVLDFALCQNLDDSGGGVDTGKVDNPAVREFVAQEVNRRIANVTSQAFSGDLAAESSFCVLNKEKDWNNAFNFSLNSKFLRDCVARTKGDVQQRLCTAGEIRSYLSSTFTTSMRYQKPNMNCNLTSWVPGCEPGWACSTGSNQNSDSRNLQDIPRRTMDCQPCCEGFFCPQGITCMIPCPLGSYCPLSTLNNDTGVCEPYDYQLPHGLSNHTCGGANIWADVAHSSEIFCSAGSYCPSNTEKIPCSSGNYCPTGSTAEKRCVKLTSCDPNTSSQNMRAYGVILIAALSTVLIIIYNCSDHIITVREGRQTRFRESAAKSVKARARARARWKSAKEAAKKHAIELRSQVSLKPSRKKDVTISDDVRFLNEADNDQDGDEHASNYIESKTTSASSTETEPSALVKMMKNFGFDNSESLNSEVKDKNVDRRVPKGKQAQTHSQMFKYAYAQLENEKAQQQKKKNLTFSGVLSMATNKEIKKRPVIEIAFRDVTVTLKGKNKHLLRSVHGIIMPGRITAVMGPSGAGKTTFLSALAGKTVGCTLTGSILINGKAESIHSYRKIIGFVPQDDIVHGNLTVEENLWFSANCRLSADMPKPDKVLIVERVIDSLGLQAVRNSLVGTVEKRGISGGQRKRVNVGLELVIEPSLLFLDEPTSGLDSASSQLLLRALCRESLEGVNICMVVHQPSYTLFKMFDDLMLLAKGGLTVYHGPAKKVEEYFARLGINVPERVNPPDYYIDVLEGLISPKLKSKMSCNELPVSWMIHKGYPVPPDMQQNGKRDANFPVGENITQNDHSIYGGINVEHSFAGEIWQDMKCYVQRHHDILHHNFLRPKDLSNRRTPNILLQYKYFLGRLGKQRLREAKTQAMDYLILLVAGACLGSLTKVKDETFGYPGYVHTIIAVSLLCKVAALRTFSLDKLQYWRESASGMSSLAHFVSKDTVDHFNTLIKPAVYLSMFYFFCNPRSSFTDNYVVLLCLVYCVTGMGYAFAIFLEPGPSQLCAVLVPVVLTLVATQTSGTKIFNIIADLSYPKWALQAFVIANAERYYGVWLITRCGALQKYGYNIHNWGLCLAILILAGLVSRMVAFLGITLFQKK